MCRAVGPGHCVFTAQFCCEPKTTGEEHMTCYQEPTLGEELQVIFFFCSFCTGFPIFVVVIVCFLFLSLCVCYLWKYEKYFLKKPNMKLIHNPVGYQTIIHAGSFKKKAI